MSVDQAAIFAFTQVGRDDRGLPGVQVIASHVLPCVDVPRIMSLAWARE
jgi:hypothetical protein